MKKNVGGQVVQCQVTSAIDGSPFTGSVTVSVTGDGGTRATGSVGAGAATNEGGGLYSYLPAQAETNYDYVSFQFAGTNAITAAVHFSGAEVVSMQDNVLGSGALASTAVAEIAKRLGVNQAGTCQSGSTATTIVLAAGASAVDDYYNNQVVALTEWTGAGQARLVLDYDGATRTATVAAWQTTPDATTEYALLQREQYTVAQLQSGLATAAALATVDDFLDTEIADILARLPAALDGSGFMKSQVKGMDADTVTSTSLAASAATKIVDALLAYAIDGTATVIGAYRRMVALATGQATGLVGTGTAEYKKQGGTTAFSASQDVVAGTRSAATIGAGLDTP